MSLDCLCAPVRLCLSASFHGKCRKAQGQRGREAWTHRESLIKDPKLKALIKKRNEGAHLKSLIKKPN